MASMDLAIEPGKRDMRLMLLIAMSWAPMIGWCADNDPVIVTVDMAVDKGPAEAPACGFLHGVNGSSPDQQLLDPLRIGLLRGPVTTYTQPDVYERLIRTGARLSVGLHIPGRKDIAGHEGKEYWPGDEGDWAPWENHVDTYVRRALDEKLRIDYWLIWNEPDDHYWGRSLEQYLETWRRAHRIIRKVNPQAAIVGPVTAKFNQRWMEDFLIYCQKNDCLPDVLCWHELRTVTGEDIPTHAHQISSWMKAKNIGISRLMVDEYASEQAYDRPGNLVSFFSNVEAAGLERAAVGVYGPKHLLCGAATADGKHPTSSWWTFKAYGEMTGRLVATLSRSPVAAVASWEPRKRILKVLLGNWDKSREIPMRLKLENVPRSAHPADPSTAQVKAQLIPCTRNNELADAKLVMDQPLTAKDGTPDVTVPSCPPGSAVAISIQMQ
jgi:hypothetical protein